MSASAREVRKTVTILFCDLVHSTGLAEGDPEAYRRVQSEFFERMRTIVERHGGTVEKFIGDEVMAVFGVPAVHEDDALRAVRAAQEMQDALPALGLQARIGINTGEVLVGDPDRGLGFVAGEAVIIAKRLEQGAATGEIIIGRATYPLVKHAVTAGPLERIPIKGKHEDVGRRRVDEVDRDAPSRARRLDIPLVGRTEDLALMHQAFERAVEERSCRLFTVLGPAGIGKSRLAGELAARVGSVATTAVGRCLPYGEGITFWPLAEILGSLGDLTEGLDGDAAMVRELLDGLVGASDATASSEEAFWAVRRAFEASAQRRPLVVCLEDVHWAEPTLLDLVEYLVGWSRDAPILVVCLARPELVERRPALISPHPNRDAIALEPLSPGESQAFLGDLVEGFSLSPEATVRIVEAAGGNPLFLEQLAATAEETDGAQVRVPPSIQALLSERLDRLTRPEREAIERASVVGRDFPLSAVVALSPENERSGLQGDLLSLVRKGLVRPDPSAQGDRFRFHHVLVRDTAYEAMPKERRAQIHEQLADWIEESEERSLEELVGYHLEQAHRYRSEIAPHDLGVHELGTRAARALAVAGRRAEAREDIPAALNFLDRAIVLMPGDRDAPLRAELLAEVGSMLMNAARFAEVEAVLEEASELARKTGNRMLELRLRIDLVFLQTFISPEGASERILEIGTAVVPELEELGDDLGLAKAWHLLSEPHIIACRWGARAEALERALEHARRAGDLRLQASMIGMLCQALLYGPASVAEATRRCEEFLVPGQTGHSIRAGVLSGLAALRAMAGALVEGRRLWEEAAAIYEELGLTYRRALRAMVPAEIALLAGDADEAVRQLQHGYRLLDEMGERGTCSTLAAYLADALYAAGDLDESHRFSEISEEMAASDDIVTQVVWRCARGKTLAFRGALEEADGLLTEAIRLAEDTDFPELHAVVAMSRAEVARFAGRIDEAESLARDAAEIYSRKGNVVAARLAAESSRVAASDLNPRREP
jgi:class 3 adenylate cyclase/tetratricopeptide (TPR) repeat protein